MKTIAFTFVQNDMVILNFWASYYSKYFDELMVMCCGTKPEHKQTLKEMEVKYNLRRENLEADEVSAPFAREIINKKQRELINGYDWVLYSNCDEILVPTKHKTINELMKRTRRKYIVCEGYEIVQEGDEKALDYDEPILRQRRSWLKNFNYNKILLSKIPLLWNEGQHQIDGFGGEESKLFKNTGLFLLHFKHADMKMDVEKRDLGPMKTSPNAYVLETMGSRKPIPKRFRNFI